jgi:type I restriction enzyme S subunit
LSRWPTERLGDLVDVLSGFAFESGHFSVTGDLPVIRIRDVVTGRSSTFYRGDFDSKFIVEDGDLLVGMDGEFNRARWRGGRALLNQRVCRIRCSSPRLDEAYLFHYLPGVLKAIERVTPFVTVKHLSAKQLHEVLLSLPPIHEQRRIAGILDAAEGLSANRRAALAKLDTLTQAVFLDMFGDPGTNPKGWPRVALGALFSVRPIFGTMIPPREDGGGWLSLRVANIQDWQLDLSDQKFVDLPKNAVARHSVQQGDLLMARAIASQDHLGKAIVANPMGAKWAFDSHLMRLRFDVGKVLPQVVRHLLMTPGGRSLFLKAARRSAVQFNINTKEMSALRVPVPPIDLQQRFERLVTEIESTRATQVHSMVELDALFASLQHRAFRGEL